MYAASRQQAERYSPAGRPGRRAHFLRIGMLCERVVAQQALVGPAITRSGSRATAAETATAKGDDGEAAMRAGETLFHAAAERAAATPPSSSGIGPLATCSTIAGHAEDTQDNQRRHVTSGMKANRPHLRRNQRPVGEIESKKEKKRREKADRGVPQAWR